MRVKVTYVTVLHVGLRKHDVCLVLTVWAKMGLQEKFDWSKSFVSQSGVEYVRGCEVEGMLDENGRVIEEGGADYLSVYIRTCKLKARQSKVVSRQVI